MPGSESCLYHGDVVHHRFRPRAHHLRYRVFSLLLDLDEIATIDRSLRFFSFNRFNLFSFHERDHGDSNGDLRGWVDRQLAAAGIDLRGGPVRILCYPRILGYVFNPLSVYYCHRDDGRLMAVLYEVSNTFGERHCYLIPVVDEETDVVRQTCDKAFYVSPFIDMGATYHFKLAVPGQCAVITIDESDGDGPLLSASFTGRKGALRDRDLIAAFLRYPLMTLKVMVGIHWEALKLWRKKTPVFDKPPPPPYPVTVVPQSRG